MILIMIEFNFLCKKKILAMVGKNSNICINMFCYENKLTFPIYVSNQKSENPMDFFPYN